MTSYEDYKESVRTASTANVSLTSPGTTMDGVTLAAGDRVLLKNQSSGIQNGMYKYRNSSTTLERVIDADHNREVTSGMQVYVEEGTVNGAKHFVLTNANPIYIGTTNLVFERLVPDAPEEPFIPTVAGSYASYLDLVKADGAISFWPLTGNAGDVAYDEGTNGYDGEYTDPAVVVSGPYSDTLMRASAFDGVDDVVTVGTDLAAFAACGSVVSLEAWINIDNWDFFHPIMVYSAANGTNTAWEWRVNDTDGKVQILRADGARFDHKISTTGVTIDTWHHVVVTIAGTGATDVKFYLDGAIDGAATGPLRAGISTGSSVALIGSRFAADMWLDGSMAFVAVYDRVLTAAEITAHYDALTA